MLAKYLQTLLKQGELAKCLICSIKESVANKIKIWSQADWEYESSRLGNRNVRVVTETFWLRVNCYAIKMKFMCQNWNSAVWLDKNITFLIGIRFISLLKYKLHLFIVCVCMYGVCMCHSIHSCGGSEDNLCELGLVLYHVIIRSSGLAESVLSHWTVTLAITIAQICLF